MARSKSRRISRLLIGNTDTVRTETVDSDTLVDIASKGDSVSGVTTLIYDNVDDLPNSANNGDQAFVTSTNNLYMFTGSGWFRQALINLTPYWITEPASSYTLDRGNVDSDFVLTIEAGDSDGTNVTYTATLDSDANTFTSVSKDSDNGRTFNISLQEGFDSDNDQSGIITFKASDGISFASKAVTINYNFSSVYLVTRANYGATWNALSFTTIYGAGTISNNSGNYSWTIDSITSNFYNAATEIKKDGDHANGAWWKVKASGMPTDFSGRSSINMMWQDGMDTGYEYRLYTASYNPDYTADPHRWSHGYTDGSGLNTGTLSTWVQAFFYNPSDGEFRQLISTDNESTWTEMTGFDKTIPASSRAASDKWIIVLAGRTGSGQTMQLLDGEDLSSELADWPY